MIGKLEFYCHYTNNTFIVRREKKTIMKLKGN